MARARQPSGLDPRQNRLLAALPEAEFQHLAPALEPVALTIGTALYESGRPQPYLYFPASGIVSLQLQRIDLRDALQRLSSP